MVESDWESEELDEDNLEGEILDGYLQELGERIDCLKCCIQRETALLFASPSEETAAMDEGLARRKRELIALEVEKDRVEHLISS